MIGTNGLDIFKILQIIILIDNIYVSHKQQKANIVTKLHHY